MKGPAQNIDSLELLLNRSDDTVKVILLNDLSKLYFGKGSFEKSDSLAVKAKSIAQKIDYQLGKYWSNLNLNSIAWHNDQFTQRIELLNESLQIAKKIKRNDLIISSKIHIALAYRDSGFDAKALELMLDAHSAALKLNDKNTLARTLRNLAVLYADDGNYALALKYYLQILWSNDGTKLESLAILNSNIALNYARLNNYDSAIYYHDKAIELYEKLFKESGNGVNMAYVLTMKGETYIKFNEFERAITYFNKAIQWHHEKYSNPRVYATCLLNISEILLRKERGNKKNLQALYSQINSNLEQAIKIFKDSEKYSNLLRACSAAKEVNELLGNYRVANEYSNLMHIVKDSLSNREQRARVKELMIQHEAKEYEQQIDKLKKESADNNLIITLLLGLLAVSLFSILLFISLQKLRYRNEKRTLELTALRSQMNPHFIFNCLNSINLYIVKSKIIEATNYLTAFSKLMRSILDNSKFSTVTLREEIKTISLYLELESMRFNDKFSYNINVSEGLDTDRLKISPMIIQPFIENAIWHGIQHKDERGNILIAFSVKNNSLICTIEDNGVGRYKALEFEKVKAESSKKSNSHGIQITKDRLNLLSRKGLKPFLQITDLIDGNKKPTGTKVEIGLPINKHS